MTPPPDDAPRAVPAALREDVEEGRLIGRGHPAGDLLEAYLWDVLEEGPGRLKLACHLPDGLRNPRGILFGGFTSTYVDLIAIFTCRAGQDRSARWRWLTTLNMRLDYIEPIADDFVVESELVNERGPVRWVQTRFQSASGSMLALAWTTLREVDD